MRVKLTIEYDGTNYFGWQRQDHAPTIQGEIEKALFSFTQESLEVYGSGRTDAGVHALAQVAHVDLPKEYPTITVLKALNFYLQPQPICITRAERVDNDFHARFSAKKRSYIYRIINRRAHLTLDINRAWHIPQKLDVRAMQQAAPLFLGKHDFTSFRASACQAPSPLKTLDEVTVTENGEMIEVRVIALSFLHHMVRNITGCLAAIGKGDLDPQDVTRLIEAKDRTLAPATAPAHGLYFWKAEY